MRAADCLGLRPDAGNGWCLAGGVAGMRTEVWSGARLVAIGVSCSLLVLPR